MSGWTFIPIIDDAGTPTPDDDTVHSFVALLDPSLVQGNQISAILYAKDATAEGGWRGAAWTTQDAWSVFGFMRDSYSVPAEDSQFWGTTQTRPSEIESAAPPEPYRRGLFESDPLDEEVGPDDPARQAMVEVLVGAGYRAANLRIENADLYADGALVLGALETGVLAKRVNGLDPEAAANAQVVAGLGWCVPWTWVIYTSPWTGTPPATWGPPASSGGAGTLVLNCTYTRSYTETQQQRLQHRYFSCNTAFCWQTRTRTTTDTMTCPDPEQVLPCPPQPSCPGTIAPQPGSASAWSPACNW